MQALRRPSRLLLGIVILAAHGCGGASTQEDAFLYEGAEFTLEIPPDWRIEERAEERAGRGVLFLSTDAVANPRALPNEVFVFLPQETYASIEAYVEEEYDFSDIKVSNRNEIGVTGATEALRFETEGKTAPPEVTVRQIFVITRHAEGSVIDVVCRGADEDFNVDVCNGILDSLQVGETR